MKLKRKSDLLKVMMSGAIALIALITEAMVVAALGRELHMPIVWTVITNAALGFFITSGLTFWTMIFIKRK